MLSYRFDQAIIRAEYVALVVVEEAFELTGVLIVIYALLDLLRRSSRDIVLHFH